MTPDTPAHAAADTLSILLPPTDMVDYLDRLWAGRQPPAHWLRWLERCRAIRAADDSIVDYVTVEEWTLIADAVGQATPPTANRTPEQLEHADRLVWTGIQNARKNEARVKAIANRRNG